MSSTADTARLALRELSGFTWAEQLESVSVIVPVMDETFSLTQTVDIVLSDADDFVHEFIIVVCDRTTPEAMAAVLELQTRLGDRVVVHHQTLPFLGGAIREAFDVASGSHVLMMASDLETDPKLARAIIEAGVSDPNGIVTVTRWNKDGGFDGYSPLKLVLNWIFQHIFALLYGVKLTDMTFGYRLIPTKLVQAIEWEELRHPFLLETITKPLRLGVSVTEVISSWEARKEGVSHNPFSQNFVYFRNGLKTRFRSKQQILRPEYRHQQTDGASAAQ